jgi:hypothetical protein
MSMVAWGSAGSVGPWGSVLSARVWVATIFPQNGPYTAAEFSIMAIRDPLRVLLSTTFPPLSYSSSSLAISRCTLFPRVQ